MPTGRDRIVVPIQPAQYERVLRAERERRLALVRSVSTYGIYLIDYDGRLPSWN